ncbi:MAG TPA: OmpA family protein [Steroidobacteraceae bacterium]|nr:OmpA family protein [Steroidobacteraceae bacterium]
MTRTRVIVALLALLSAAASHAKAAAKIPFVEGLTIVRAVSTPTAEYESIRTIRSLSEKGYLINTASEVLDDSGTMRELSITREVLAADQREARKMRLYFHTNDPENFPGTTPGISRAILLDLKTQGSAELTFLDVGSALIGGSKIKRTLKGSVTRMGAVNVPMLVNGRRVMLAGVRAKGRVTDTASSEELEFVALDDPDNPLLLQTRGPGISGATTIKIDFPESTPASDLERSLAAGEIVEVRSIYFAFASDRMRPQSDRVLREIADVLKKHPEWKLRIDGHTDSIGNDAANLDLSKRRSGAVVAALSQRLGIDASRLVADGHGEGAPLESNHTPEGRARNRRVELRRL